MMHREAQKHIADAARTGDPLPTMSDIKIFISRVAEFRCALTFGAASIVLYVLLYMFSTDLTQLAQSTHAGHKGLFFVPILLALVFSLIHGNFTSHFWDSLGIKAKTS